MATNKPVGDNARKGAVRKRTQLKGKVMGKTAWTKRNKESGQFMDVKKSKMTTENQPLLNLLYMNGPTLKYEETR